MINIANKFNCSGCTACAEKCPHKCIVMKPDDEGFLYPVVDDEKCVHCNLCDSVCPVLNQGAVSLPLSVFASRQEDDRIINESSSGGIFSILAEYVLKEEGVVFGARFDDDWNVIHSYTEHIEELSFFRGSKYVQSNIGNSYQDVERFLKDKRNVLFSGTPCQIAGLKKYLRQEYDNLITIAIICHGVPSPLVWKEYLKKLPAKLVDGENTLFSSLKCSPVITGINFRDKTDGWRQYGFSVIGTAERRDGGNTAFPFRFYTINEYHQENTFMRGYLHNLYLRPSCYHCPARKGKCGADIQLGDFWGVQRRYPQFYDPQGVSIVLLYTKKGKTMFENLKTITIPITYDDVLDCNRNVEIDETEPKFREAFFKSFHTSGIRAINRFCDKIDRRGICWYIKKYLVKVKNKLLQ